MAQNKVLKNIPKTETICLKLKNEEGKLMYIVTEKFTGIAKEYIIYKVEEDNTYSDSESGNMTLLGNLYITGYVETGNPTASGVYPYVGGVAMSTSYGLPYGTTIYIEGLGYYTLFDTGCNYGVVDVFCNTVDECYNLTSWRNVYVVN